MPIVEHGHQIGINSVPAGAKVKLERLNGMTIDISYQGQTKKNSASLTDLLPRMLGTADDVSSPSVPAPTTRLATPTLTSSPLVSIEFKNGAVYYGRALVKSPVGITFQIDGTKVYKIPASLLSDKTAKELVLGPALPAR